MWQLWSRPESNRCMRVVSTVFSEHFHQTASCWNSVVLAPRRRARRAGTADGQPVAKKPVGRPKEKGSTWEQFINMNRVKGAHISPTKYVTYCQQTVDDDGNKRDPLLPVMFKKLADLSPYWMQIDYSKVNNNISWQVVPEQDPPFTPDEGEGELWY